MVFVALLLGFGLRWVAKVLFAGEIATVLKSRSRSRSTWAIGLLILAALLFFVPGKSIHSGDFEVRTDKSELAQADDMLPKVETNLRGLRTEARRE